MTYLLDTNVVSELRKSRPDRFVLDWWAAVESESIYLSVLVLGELRQGVERLRRRDVQRAAALEEWLRTLRSTYAERVVPITTDIAEEWGRLSVPDPLPYVDGLLAATARVHGWTLVTRNTKDISRTGASVLNPFDETWA